MDVRNTGHTQKTTMKNKEIKIIIVVIIIMIRNYKKKDNTLPAKGKSTILG